MSKKTTETHNGRGPFKSGQLELELSPEDIIKRELHKLETQMYTIDDRLLDATAGTNADLLSDELLETKKQKMRTLIRLNAIYYEHNAISKKTYAEYKEKVEHIDMLLTTYEEYNTSNTQKQIKKGIDMLTMVTVIVLPVTLLTSFFGMNFKSLGSLTTKQGWFTVDNAHCYVGLFILLYMFTIASSLHYKNVARS
jgi:Mg2+ and Co2+ transporter CorA